MTFRLVGGDAIEAMQSMAESSVDAIVTDPPYGLEFMGKEWDRLLGRGGPMPRTGPERNGWSTGPERPTYRAGIPAQEWHHAWATEALRILKPGGHLLAFGGTRTYHRLACAIEDAGFEIRDCIAWMYGSGFPKSLDVSKAIDKKRDDYEATCAVALWLRPHVERAGFDVVTEAFGFGDQTMARARWTSRSQPQVPSWDQWERLRTLCGFGDEMDAEVWRLNGRKGTPGENWDKREVVGESRHSADRTYPRTFTVADEGIEGLAPEGRRFVTAPATPEAQRWNGWGTALKPAFEPIVLARKPLAERNVAANVQRWGTGALNIDGCRIEGEPWAAVAPNNGGRSAGIMGEPAQHPGGDPHPAGRWPANVTLDETAAAMLDEQTGERPGMAQGNLTRNNQRNGYDGGWKPEVAEGVGYGDTGGASRFFYCPKADREERNRGLEHMAQRSVGIKNDSGRGFSETNPYRDIRAANHHPTVKPVELMRWLCRMVTPKGGTVLDPFTGSGSTGVAAMREGFEFIGIEREPDYVEIARARIIGDAPLFAVEVNMEGEVV